MLYNIYIHPTLLGTKFNPFKFKCLNIRIIEVKNNNKARIHLDGFRSS